MEAQFPALIAMNVLVVEDEAVIVMLLEETLEGFGCVVHTASSVERARAVLRTHQPDGVLLDMNLHGSRTVTLAQELADRSIPFLLVTGYDAGGNDSPAIKAAARLQKPFTEEDLGRRMVEVFARGAIGA